MHVSAGAYCGVREELEMRRLWPELPSYMEIERGKVHGLVHIGHSLPTSMVKDVPGVETRYKVANVVTEYLPGLLRSWSVLV